MEQSNSGNGNVYYNVYGLVAPEIFNGNGTIHDRLLITLSETDSNVVLWRDDAVPKETSDLVRNE